MRDFFDPSPEVQNVVLINSRILRKAETLIGRLRGMPSKLCGRSFGYCAGWPDRQ